MSSDLRAGLIGRRLLRFGKAGLPDVVSAPVEGTVPHDLHIDYGRRIVTYVVRDPYTFDEWRTLTERVLTDSQVPRPLKVLIDHSLATAPLRDFAERIVKYLEHHRDQVSGSRVAVIVQDEANFGMGRMVELLAGGRQLPVRIRVLNDRDEGRRWLEHGTV